MTVGLRANQETAASIHRFLKSLANEFLFLVEPVDEHRSVPSLSTIEQLTSAIPSLLDKQAAEFIENVSLSLRF